jgi:hypothetical protein
MNSKQITQKQATKLLSSWEQIIVRIGNEEFRYATLRRRGLPSRLTIFCPDKRVEERDIVIADIAKICKEIEETRGGTFWISSPQE